VSDFTTKTIAQIRDGVRAGDFSAREVASSFNDAVAAGRALNAWTVETPELALAAAHAA
jgi:aspartyl-tRNA(Asn)/glutamyl-tRNA(Gln) amidotransferase subunit A